jgi:hypothetical protein
MMMMLFVVTFLFRTRYTMISCHLIDIQLDKYIDLFRFYRLRFNISFDFFDTPYHYLRRLLALDFVMIWFPSFSSPHAKPRLPVDKHTIASAISFSTLYTCTNRHLRLQYYSQFQPLCHDDFTSTFTSLRLRIRQAKWQAITNTYGFLQTFSKHHHKILKIEWFIARRRVVTTTHFMISWQEDTTTSFYSTKLIINWRYSYSATICCLENL